MTNEWQTYGCPPCQEIDIWGVVIKTRSREMLRCGASDMEEMVLWAYPHLCVFQWRNNIGANQNFNIQEMNCHTIILWNDQEDLQITLKKISSSRSIKYKKTLKSRKFGTIDYLFIHSKYLLRLYHLSGPALIWRVQPEMNTMSPLFWRWYSNEAGKRLYAYTNKLNNLR